MPSRKQHGTNSKLRTRRTVRSNLLALVPESIFHLLQHSKLVCRRTFFFVLRKLMYLIDLKSSWTVWRFQKFTNLINQLETFYKPDEGSCSWDSSRMHHLLFGNINHCTKPTRFKTVGPLNFSNKFVVLSGNVWKLCALSPFWQAVICTAK